MPDFETNTLHATRRQLLLGAAATTVSLALPRHVLAAPAHTFTHGAFDITVVSDGMLMLPPEILLPDANAEERADFLKRLGGNEKGAAVQANIPLIRHGSDLILIDTGAGPYFQASAGRLAENLNTVGVKPEEITKVVFTHVHPDHSGGTTTPDGKVLFPNAHYYVGEAEAAFWTDRSLLRPATASSSRSANSFPLACATSSTRACVQPVKRMTAGSPATSEWPMRFFRATRMRLRLR